jgi:hypothetical protein
MLRNPPIARTPFPENDPPSTTRTQSLSLYITSLMLDFPQSEFEMSASMMTAIKCQDDRTGERGARPDWVWEFWQNDWTFRRESEVWGEFLSFIPLINVAEIRMIRVSVALAF